MRLLFVGAPLLAAAATAALVVRFATGSDGPGDPGAFVAQLVRDIAADDYAGAWTTLHPTHQRIASLEAYVACETMSPIPGRLTSIRVLGIADKQVRVAGDTGTVAGKAVRIRLSITGAGRDPIVLTHTGHAVEVAGHWTWILPPERLASYRAGRCPS